jgi:hypothetical protein
MGRRSAPSGMANPAPVSWRVCGIAGAIRLWDCCSRWKRRSCEERLESIDPAQDFGEKARGCRLSGRSHSPTRRSLHNADRPCAGASAATVSDHRSRSRGRLRPRSGAGGLMLPDWRGETVAILGTGPSLTASERGVPGTGIGRGTGIARPGAPDGLLTGIASGRSRPVRAVALC